MRTYLAGASRQTLDSDLRTRDVLAHQYFVADLDIVWQAVNEELPGLEAAVKELLTKGGGA